MYNTQMYGGYENIECDKTINEKEKKRFGIRTLCEAVTDVKESYLTLRDTGFY